MQRLSGGDTDVLGLGIRSASPNDMGLIPTITHPDLDHDVSEVAPQQEQQEQPTAGRNKVRKWFTAAGSYLGDAAHQKLDVSDYNDQQAHRFPEVPGEPLRNPALERISKQYSELREQNSRAESTYAASFVSTSGIEGGSTPPPQASPRPETSPSRKPRRRDTLEVPTPVHIHRRADSH
jgi:hypothetical protein